MRWEHETKPDCDTFLFCDNQTIFACDITIINVHIVHEHDISCNKSSIKLLSDQISFNQIRNG